MGNLKIHFFKFYFMYLQKKKPKSLGIRFKKLLQIIFVILYLSTWLLGNSLDRANTNRRLKFKITLLMILFNMNTVTTC